MKTNTARSAPPAIRRRAQPLVGLLVPLGLSACIVDLRTAYPLVDESAAPACGNIGQVGRPQPPLLRATATLTPAPVFPAPHVAPEPPRDEPRVAAVLLGPPAGEDAARAACAARPLVDAACDPACGNIPTKGGCHRAR